MSKFVVHCKRAPFDVLIDRRTKWGNPFVIGTHGDRERVIQEYRAWIAINKELTAAAKTELRGKVLGCWCAPLPCHGDVLAHIANEES